MAGPLSMLLQQADRRDRTRTQLAVTSASALASAVSMANVVEVHRLGDILDQVQDVVHAC